MHELSIALGSVKIAESEKERVGAHKIEGIELQIGTLSGVELDSLEFAWPLAVKDSALEHSEKRIDVVEGEAQCLECEQKYELTHIFDACPNCKSYFKDILHGQELRVKALEVT